MEVAFLRKNYYSYSMKVVALLLFLIPSKVAHSQDYLLSAMLDSWRSNSCTCPSEYENAREEYESAEPESYSWDNLYFEPYADTEVILNPYGE